jgi:hypothetical protein
MTKIKKVRAKRLELSYLTEPPPQDGVSTNFTMRAGLIAMSQK